MFEMFSQLESALDRAEGGLGIGLALTKGLVELHGGTIVAKSEGVGRGSTFTVRLPTGAIDATSSRTTLPQAVTTPLPPRRILVADDNKDAAVALAMYLELQGHAVRTAHDGIEALEIAQAFRPDIALLDIGMPKLNGYDVARRMRGEPWGGNSTLIAVTGWGQEEDRQRAASAGFSHHLTKPVSEQTLLSLLAQGVRAA
ncbi:MAG TPA: response regulator [Casimicrobiaceae bacterium]|nr:response regulator [Casimicrobiaceae bacterium]